MRDDAVRRRFRFPDAFVEFPPAAVEQTISARFEHQADRGPERVAVHFAGRDITYGALNRAANRAARGLLARVGGGAAPVALLIDPGLDLVVWILAVLKAGLFYAPLDRRLAGPAVSAMVDRLGPCAIVTDAGDHDAAPPMAPAGCPLLAAACDYPGFPDHNLPPAGTPDSFAHVFHTSGSTGAPHGVVDCHRNVLHNVMRYTNTLGFAPGDRMSMVQHPSFSGIVSSLFGALLNGATVVPFDLERSGLARLPRWVRAQRITVFHAVPSVFRQLTPAPDRYPDLRLVRLEGDRSTPRDVRHFQAACSAECVLVNGFGATECGLVSQWFVDGRSAPDDAVPIGYPVPGMRVWLADAAGAPCPPGATGEMVVESAYLASGYWRHPSLTAQRFRPGAHAARCYHTGDVARVDADGCVTHLGRRRELQVKIRGVLVDLEAVESALLALPAVAQAAVEVHEDARGEQRLVAHIVIEEGGPETAAEVRASLARRVSPAMIPSAIAFLDALPLTRDLKVDRARLRSPARAGRAAPEPAATPVEAFLASLWGEVLGLDEVGVTDSFLDLGGDSLHAAQLAARLNDALGRDIGVDRIFAYPTVRELARALALEPAGLS